LNTLHEVENEELANIRVTNTHAANVMSESISRMNLLMLGFFLAAAILVYLILIDISKSNYYKTQLEKARDEAEELSKIKQRFLANMSHEIRTPLQSIIGFTEQLKYEGAENPDAVNAIHSSSEHLLHIVNEVLDYSRISSGNFTLAKEKFKLFALIREVESAMRIQAERKKLTFMLDNANAADHALIGDPFRLRQILYNLLGNAIKFTHKGFVKLKLQTHHINNKILCVFEISDTGIGIKAEDIHKIFNQFEQANASITGQYGGTGLGLTIVKSLLDAQQGQLQVSSEPGVGSAFRVEIEYEEADISTPVILATSENANTKFTGKIIVVDDDSMILKLCSIILDKNKIHHNTYNDPDKVMRLAPQEAVTHILLDIRMPNMNGIDLCKNLKPKYPSATKFIALTAHVLPEERDNLLLAGFDDILTKPFHEAELLKKLGITSQVKIHAMETPDFSLVREMTMGDESLFQSVITQFVDETADDIERLHEHLDNQNKKAVREIVHKMAGRTGQMGLFSISASLREVEIAIVDGKSVEDIESDLKKIILGVSEVLEGIRHTAIEHHG
jgi:signal transduction histidine kinase/CheY-like chemotaxis protein/HPt (histidine-containing phosphotransfer) domain-containing protein